MRLLVSLCIASVFILSGCNGNPINNLKSDSDNNGRDYKYWDQQYKANTPIWHQAVQYCLPHADKSNCQIVLHLAAFGDGSYKPPKIGESGESIHLET